MTVTLGTQKTLHLIRHSYASEGAPGTPDIERPLSQQGEATCQFMAAKIASSGYRFNAIFVSPARRAQATIEIISDHSGTLSLNWETDSGLYTFDWHALLEWLVRQDDSLDELVIVGHNPAISRLVVFLTGEDVAQVPPCSWLTMGVDISHWADLYRECGVLVGRVYPDGCK